MAQGSNGSAVAVLRSRRSHSRAQKCGASQVFYAACFNRVEYKLRWFQDAQGGLVFQQSRENNKKMMTVNRESSNEIVERAKNER